MTISYTTASWNPWIGCSPVSEGCLHCYAARDAATRLAHNPDYKGLARRPETLMDVLAFPGFKDEPHAAPKYLFTGSLKLRRQLLDAPIRKTKPQRYFVCSTSDFFVQPGIVDDWRDEALATMLLEPRHTFLVLTKRINEALGYFAAPDLYDRVLREAEKLRQLHKGLIGVGVSDPAHITVPWIWWGVTVEHERHLGRIDQLRKMPAEKRWLSLEPLLTRLDLRGKLEGINWVVVGGESGYGARPCHGEWIDEILAACDEAKVPAYLKQMGENYHEGGGPCHIGRRGHAGRDPACWGVDYENRRNLPEFWQCPVAFHNR